ncbi:heme-binding peroxidase [Histoplasma capsulatum var. duboisii H88]|uniref:Heme-binding peroxidase n=3 Tax=Ajellomyces capsulatus TaxID=5037 RepID=A0A8A1LE65_AJEC8|nr:heme-binding peroxidase [Histoplasma capsulatum var. duboisii H88]
MLHAGWKFRNCTMPSKRFLPWSKGFRFRKYTKGANLVDLSPLSTLLCNGVMEDLSKEIFDAIREHHTSFGSLVAKRVPLCLPPRTDTPALYAFGISRFAEIYFAFEEAWISQLSQLPSVSGTGSPDEYEILDSFVNDDRGRIRSILSQLYIPELLRSEKLRADLRALGWSPGTEDSSQDAPSDDNSSSKDDDAYGNAATAFAAHIKSATAEHPHLIMVYTWIMYLILLNGGRRIRTKLAAGGHDFWKTSTESNEDAGGSGSGIPNGLTFWFFHRDDKDLYDDEGIKQEFKARLHSASNLLSVSERAQIIVEAVNIFRHCSHIVAEIDVEVKRAGMSGKMPGNSRSNSHGRTGSRFLSSIRDKLPTYASGILRRPSDSSTQKGAGRGARLRPVFVGAAGLLAGLCALVWSMNSDPSQGKYAFWKAGNETDG